jgi:hypothetical protein
MAGDEIVMPENAFLMIHDPSGPVMGNVSRGSGPSTSTTLAKFLNAGNWSLQGKRFCIRTSGSTESYASTNLWLKLPVGCLAQHPPESTQMQIISMPRVDRTITTRSVRTAA